MSESSDVAEAPALDPVALIEITTELVAADVTKNHARAAELPNLIVTVHASLSGLGGASKAAAEPAKLVPPASIRKSVTDDDITSLEDGDQYQSLKRHLSGCGFTPAEYRTTWDLPADCSMVAPAYSARRSELAKSTGLGSMRRIG